MPDVGRTVRRHRALMLTEVEREHIIHTLQQVRGNKAVAARLQRPQSQARSEGAESPE